MKNKGIIIALIILLSIIAMALLGFMIFIIAWNGKSDFLHTGNKKTTLIIDEKVSVDDILGIDFDLIELDINVFPSEDEYIHVKVYDNDTDHVKYQLLDNIISLTEEERSGVFLFYFGGNNKVDLYIPNNYLERIDFKTISGDIEIKGSYTNEFNIDTISGDVNANIIGKVDIKTVSGDISINKCELKNIITTSGDIDLDLVNVVGTSSIKTVSGDIEIERIDNVYIETNTVSGDVLISNNDRKSDNELVINTTSGDIDIN